MKKITLITAVLLFVCISIKAQSSGNAFALGSTYQDLAEIYSVQAQGKEMSKQEEEKILKNISAEQKAKLEEIKKLDRNKYYQILRNQFTYNWIVTGDDNKLAEAFGAAYSNEKEKKGKELDLDVELLALRLKNADSGSQQKIRNELSGKLSELFDIKEAQKQNEVQKLEKRIQELKESLQARKQNKNEIIQRRIQELMGDARYLKWE